MSVRNGLLRYLVFPFAGRLYNQQFGHFFREWQASQYWDAARLEAYRWHRLKTLLTHAAKSVPFYRDYFREEGLSLGDFRSFEDLRKLPVLNKDDYGRKGLKQFISECVPRKRLIRESTSGTTGRPFSFFIDRQVVASKMARLLRENLWANWKAGDPYVRIWGEHRETLVKRLFYQRLMGRHEVPAFGIDQEFDRIIRTFETIRPRIVEAYTSAAVHLARVCRDKGQQLPPPESIIVSAETLTEAHRSLLEKTIGGKVYNRYGSREFGNLAHECRLASFHINAESAFLEEEDHPSIANAKNLVVTFFDNFSMPFIRYRTGDLGRLSMATCQCGVTLPLLEQLEGRATDFFVFAEGRSLSFLFFNHFFEQYGGIVDLYQVVQTSPNDLQIRIVLSKQYFGDVEKAMSERLSKRFGGSPRFEVLPVEEIPRETSGKLRIYKPLKSL